MVGGSVAVEWFVIWFSVRFVRSICQVKGYVKIVGFLLVS